MSIDYWIRYLVIIKIPLSLPPNDFVALTGSNEYDFGHQKLPIPQETIFNVMISMCYQHAFFVFCSLLRLIVLIYGFDYIFDAYEEEQTNKTFIKYQNYELSTIFKN